ncbi:rod shape-determining protein MreC [Akkermansiaceae bacterium]|nr:rod shape-determining protein MreC [Akkermansiaceae bacterium]
MRPLNFIALLLFIAGTMWVFTRSEKAVRKIQDTYYSAISPFVSKGGEIDAFATSFMEEVEHSENLRKRLEQATRERDRFKLIASRIRELETENNELRNALDFKKQTEFDVVAAHVVRRQPLTWGSTVEIDRGAADHIGVSLCVLASNGGLVGQVHQPGDEVSSVLLITDEASQVAVRIEGTPEVGILVGRRTNYGEQPRLRLLSLSKNAVLQKGMKVYTNGRGQLFPPDIPVGTIEDFEAGPNTTEAEIIPSVDFNNLKTVFVITDSPGD